MINDYWLEKTNEETLELMRSIRNSCSEYMTRNTEKISYEDQIKWFSSLNQKAIYPFLFGKTSPLLGPDGDEYLGYGIVRIENNNYLLTGGLLPKHRGQGYGKILFSKLIEKCSDKNVPISLEVLKNNMAAVKTYKKLGFVISDETEKIYRMVLLNEDTYSTSVL